MELYPGKVMTLEEAAEKHPRQWLAVKVIERDKDSGQPTKVRILANNVDVFSVRNKIGLDDVCTFYTGPIPEVNTVLML